MSARKGTFKAAVVPKAGAAFELRDIPFRSLGPHEVLIKVEACGCCHSDSITKEGHMPIQYFPRVPGHEVIGVIEEMGSGVPSLPRLQCWASESAGGGTAATAGAASNCLKRRLCALQGRHGLRHQ